MTSSSRILAHDFEILYEICIRIPFSVRTAEQIGRKLVALILIVDQTYRFIPLKQDHPSAFVTRRQIVSCMIKLYCWYDIRCEKRCDGQLDSCATACAAPLHCKRDKIYSSRFDLSRKSWMDSPSVISSTSPLSPKHWANLQPPDWSPSFSITTIL